MIPTDPLHRRRRLGVIPAIAAIGLAAASCGASQLTIEDLDPATQNLVLFESGWQCEVGRFAVDDPAALEQMRLDRRADHQIDEVAYAAFLADLAADDDLRNLVADQTSNCLDTGQSVRL